jgi:hypothetical protein
MSKEFDKLIAEISNLEVAVRDGRRLNSVKEQFRKEYTSRIFEKGRDSKGLFFKKNPVTKKYLYRTGVFRNSLRVTAGRSKITIRIGKEGQARQIERSYKRIIFQLTKKEKNLLATLILQMLISNSK